MSDARPAEGVDPVTGTAVPRPQPGARLLVPGRSEAAAAKMDDFGGARASGRTSSSS